MACILSSDGDEIMAEIVFCEDENEELERFVADGFEEHSAENGTSADYNEFTFAAKGGNDIVGAVMGHAYYNEVHISELIVRKEYRGKDIGTALIKAVEDRFRDKGYDHISLTTHRFQAAGFYEKCGFTVEFIRKSRTDPKLDKYFMVKYI